MSLRTFTLKARDLTHALAALKRRCAAAESADYVRKVIADINGKGGVGKSSLAAAVAAAFAAIGKKVLLIELDPQGNNAEDLGFHGTPLNDNGQAQVDAILHGKSLIPTGEARPNLFVVPGGALVEQIVEELYVQRRLCSEAPELLVQNAWMGVYASVLEPLRDEYDLIILDIAPGYETLQLAGLAAADMSLIPAKSDPSSRKGLRAVASRFVLARLYNPVLVLLGVVLFGVNASASKVEEQIREHLEKDLGGAAPVFSQAIRHVEAAAVACRTRGKVPAELRDTQPDASLSPAVLKSIKALAMDYEALTYQILKAIVEANKGVIAK
ncbi:AAA family ATPase [Streptomyces sp. AV19]|uniref:ParA family protein n=1 Tax=Streptomyces sp. AV19 TaxID=2793068 RepID=UPI0018FEE3D4|nr:ParA family protein [Streptomyces sp. AV19]MBH1939211.1 AAA family ATPase [Streptomyces sp. AV19]MDG4537207.1 AAA family ATPase [Streptomyces sp. AV19]